ncbi:MAG: single-stranded-DNA-specific exonuclease RecJ, partial [Eubacteriales bacterium]
GDYDADGVTATSILFLYLSGRGADVHFYIPGRFDEGYGLNENAIRALDAEGTRLIITVDTGVTAIEEAAVAARLGMDLIITDHHTCREILPAACAVINPHRPDDDYPFKDLAGVGVAFKLVCALETYGVTDKNEMKNAVGSICRSYAEYAAIGTIADVMPLRGENRLLVNLGLALMADSKHPGIPALADRASVSADSSGQTKYPPKKKKITSSFIAFTIAPRINAAGRIARASRAVELFLTDSPEEANRLAAELCDANNERKETESRIAEEAFLQVETEHDLSREHILILAGEGWHHGVIGIVASRVTEKYHLPSILISYDSDGHEPQPTDEGKGSGRSIDGFCMIDALNDCSDLLVRYGGHAQAAGMTVTREKLPEFRRRMEACAGKALSDGVPPPTLEIDCETDFTDITLQTAQNLYQLEPYGVGNPQPLFCLRDAIIGSVTPLSGGRHTKLMLIDPDNDALIREAMLFGQKTETFPYGSGDIADVVYTMDINEFRGEKRVQMIVSDIRPTDRCATAHDVQNALYRQCRAGIPIRMPEGITETDMLPARNDCKALYLLLRTFTDSGTKAYPCTYTQLCYHSHLGLCKVRLICDMFEETGLISRKKADEEGFTCVLDTTPGKKIDLTAAPSMCALRQLFGISETAL